MSAEARLDAGNDAKIGGRVAAGARVTTSPSQARCLNPMPQPLAVDRILVIRLGALGDVVRTLPAVAALRAHYPNAHLAWLVERKAAGVVTSHSDVDEVLVFPREDLHAALLRGRLPTLARTGIAFINELRSRRFELVVDFHAILKSGVLSRLSGAPQRVSYAPPHGREAAWLFASRRAELAPSRMSRFERNAGLVRFLGVPCHDGSGSATPSEEARRRARVALGAGPAPVVIHPGTSEATPYKRYTVEGYASVARALLAVGVPVIVTAGPEAPERAFAAAIVSQSGGAARLAPETPDIEALSALFTCCRAFVGSDSGPLHLASLVGTPVVQILGPTDPLENKPWSGAPAEVVRVPVPCSPCRRGCEAATCMKSIPPGLIVDAVQRLLGAAPFLALPRSPDAAAQVRTSSTLRAVG